MSRARVIAIVGAESTGKSTLAQSLGVSLRELTGLRVATVDEWLRQWCAQAGRTPARHEQLDIAREQTRRIEEARGQADLVVADTTALMTAVYSRLVFEDDSLVTEAVAVQAGYELTLFTANDVAWEPDGLQRDGPHVREAVAGHLRDILLRHGLGWSRVSGLGEARLACALDALTPRLSTATAPRTGLLSRLQAREAAQPAWRWACETCDDPDCEHLSLRSAKPPA